MSTVQTRIKYDPRSKRQTLMIQWGQNKKTWDFNIDTCLVFWQYSFSNCSAKLKQPEIYETLRTDQPKVLLHWCLKPIWLRSQTFATKKGFTVQTGIREMKSHIGNDHITSCGKRRYKSESILKLELDVPEFEIRCQKYCFRSKRKHWFERNVTERHFYLEYVFVFVLEKKNSGTSMLLSNERAADQRKTSASPPHWRQNNQRWGNAGRWPLDNL